MDSFTAIATKERGQVFTQIGSQMGISPIIAEKDFWVSWSLAQVFGEIELDHSLIFKGGTSLSKVHGVIDRFSEDIDLAFDRYEFGFNDGDFKNEGINARKRRLDALTENCTQYISETFVPSLEKVCQNKLGEDWVIEIDGEDPQTILFQYPQSLTASEYKTPGYIRPAVRLELGARSDHTPYATHEIMPYAAEHFPSYYKKPKASVLVLSAERTFWEKLTILHAEYFRPEGNTPGLRLSRHYYDAYKLFRSEFGERAIKDSGLLKTVADHKNFFFRSGWARYDLAKPGTLELVPEEALIKWLKKDYKEMEEMIFGDVPTFEEIIKALEEMENIINA